MTRWRCAAILGNSPPSFTSWSASWRLIHQRLTMNKSTATICHQRERQTGRQAGRQRQRHREYYEISFPSNAKTTKHNAFKLVHIIFFVSVSGGTNKGPPSGESRGTGRHCSRSRISRLWQKLLHNRRAACCGWRIKIYRHEHRLCLKQVEVMVEDAPECSAVCAVEVLMK